MTRFSTFWLILIFLNPVVQAADRAQLRVGSKTFTESVILGCMAEQSAKALGATVDHRRALGGTQILFHALEAGEIDVYPEYLGTIAGEILAGSGATDETSIRAALAKRGIGMSRSLGFSNTYALGMKAARAEALGLSKISDLARHPELSFGFSNEFVERLDGWPKLRERYGLPQKKVRGLDHDLAYRAIDSGEIDLTDLYSTDAEIRRYALRVLKDDRSVFPSYEAVWLYRLDLSETLQNVFKRLEGRIDAETMAGLNARVKLDKETEDAAAASFLREKLGEADRSTVDPWWKRLIDRGAEHLALVGVSLVAAIVVAVPLGLWAARKPRAGGVILAVVGVIQTIPSLALLVFMIPILGIGAKPAVVALFLYGLLPIVRNTHAGLSGIAPGLIESAEALGLSPWSKLWRIELPLASRSILAGIKTAAVIDVGTATIGALIGAGGFGQPILTGIRRDDPRMILLEGAIPAAVLALAVQGAFDLLERAVVPRGLRSRRP